MNRNEFRVHCKSVGYEELGEIIIRQVDLLKAIGITPEIFNALWGHEHVRK
jgi:hypothetical protein